MVLIVAQFRAAYKKKKTMKKPTIEEVLELVSFSRDDDGKLYVRDVYGSVSSVHSNVKISVHGSVGIVHGNVVHVCGNVFGDVEGDVGGNVGGKVKGKVLNSLD